MTALSASPDAALTACPAVAVQHVDTRDVDEQAALLTDWHQDYAQLSAGGFEGRIDEAWLDGVHLFVEATSQRLHQRGELRADRLALGLPLALPEVVQAGPARFCGRSDWQAAQSNALELLVGAAALPPDAGQRPRLLVEQARAIVDRDPETPVTVATLCAELRTSRRTLQAAFQQVLGLAPAAYLRATRLAGARRALRQAPSVTEAAAQWGFWHFGHFAQDYRRMYGELPSQTWRRLHPGAGGAAH